MRLVVRADGSALIGLGHLSRTSAIAAVATTRGIDVRYATVRDPFALDFLARRGLSVVPIDGELRWSSLVGTGDAVVLDGYEFTDTDVLAIRATGAVAVVVDDTGVAPLAADLVVNPNVRLNGAGPTVLSGTEYALVHPAYLARRRRRAGGAGTLLLTFGGSDPLGVGPSAVAALDDHRPFRHVVLVEGPAAEPVALERSWLDVVSDPADVVTVFDSCDAAVSAAGSTCWELLALGIPTGLVLVADNQNRIAEEAISAGAAIAAGHPSGAAAVWKSAIEVLAAPAAQARLSDSALRLVDGHGPRRVVDRLVSLARRRDST